MEMSKPEIKRLIRKYDSKKWEEGLERKASVGVYRSNKKEIKEDKIYDNSRAAQILFQARANCMALNERNRHTEGGETRCEICNDGEMDSYHNACFTSFVIQINIFVQL